MWCCYFYFCCRIFECREVVKKILSTIVHHSSKVEICTDTAENILETKTKTHLLTRNMRAKTNKEIQRWNRSLHQHLQMDRKRLCCPSTKPKVSKMSFLLIGRSSERITFPPDYFRTSFIVKFPAQLTQLAELTTRHKTSYGRLAKEQKRLSL